MGLVTFLAVRFVEVAVVLLLILFMPNIPPKSNFSYFKVTPALKFEGKLALNNRLKNAERLYENELKGPEAFAEYNNELYTSLLSGEIVKLTNGKIVPVAKFGRPCTEYVESVCGRPLGINFDKNGILYAVDSYMGIWKVDIKTGQKTLLVSMDEEIEGKKPMIPNSIALAENGDFYWTDSSTEFKLENGIFTLLADGSGRVVHYNAKTKTNKVLLDGLLFANGIILSAGEEFLVISETGMSRLHRYYLKGTKKGQHDIFLDGLPGMPDNIQSDGKDGYFVPLIIAKDAAHPQFTQMLGPFPLIRKLIARILSLAELGFSTLNNLYPNVYTQGVVHWIGHFESIGLLMPDRVTILHVSKTGEIIDSLHTTDKHIIAVSEAFIFDNYLYLGSPFTPYLSRVPLAKAGLSHLSRPKREAPAVKQEAPKQKQTPPPPTTTPTPPKQQTKPVTTTNPPPKQSPPPQQAPPSRQTVPSQQAPPRQAPPSQQAPPSKQAPPPSKQAPPPSKQAPPTQQAPPRQAPPSQQAPPSKQAPPPSKQAPPTQQAPPPRQAPPSQQAPPTKQTPPSQQASPTKPPQQAQPVKQAPPPSKQAPPPSKQAPQPASTTATPSRAQQTKDTVKETPKVVPVKENSVPKSESIKPRK